MPGHTLFSPGQSSSVAVGECSRSVAARSQLGAVALICWAAALSCTSQPPAKHKRASLARPSSRPVLLHKPSAHAFRAVHTTTRPRSLPSPQALVDQARSSAHRAPISSLIHPHQPRPDSWLDRLTSSLASIFRAIEHDTEQRSDSHQVHLLPRRKARATGLIHQYIKDPEIYDPIVSPRHPIVLCHGLYGFDVRGPFLGLEIHYWAETLDILRKKIGAEVLIHGVPGTGSIQERAESLHKFLCSEEAGVRGKKLNFIGHSMGGLDVRYLLTHIRPTPEQYIPLSLTTVNTPHRGSPFMDWCNANVGTGNDYIEKAIAEARNERAHLADSERGSSRAVKVPYTLKSPLFIRPKPLDGSSQAKSEPKASKPLDESSGSAKPKTSPPQDPKAVKEREQDSETENLFGAASAAVSELAGHAKTTASNEASARSADSELTDKVKEVFKRGQRDDGKLPFGLSGFIGSLTSLTGAFSSYMLSLLDTPAYAMLSTAYMNEAFNPKTPNVEGVKYYSVAARTSSVGIWHPLWLPKLILDAAAESRTAGGETDGSADALGSPDQGNDGLVNVESAKWGEFLGIMEGCDHWDLRGGGAPRWKQNINPATGKPYPNKELSKPEGDKSSWSDINRLLFSRTKANTTDPAQFLKTYKELAREEGWAGVSIQDMEKTEDWLNEAQRDSEDDDSEQTVASFHPAEHRDDTLVHELASWISDRLPTGDAERRALADERDKLINQTGLQFERPPTSPPNGSETDKNSPPSHPFVNSATGANVSTSPAHTAQFSTSPRSDGTEAKPKRKSLSDLEQFWIAISRHLHNQGL